MGNNTWPNEQAKPQSGDDIFGPDSENVSRPEPDKTWVTTEQIKESSVLDKDGIPPFITIGASLIVALLIVLIITIIIWGIVYVFASLGGFFR